MLKTLIPQIEVEILLAHLFECPRKELYMNNPPIDEDIEDSLNLLIERRLSGEPLQYITGRVEFMGRDFIVDKNVFIPRPETEILVEEVIRVTGHPSASLGTGESRITDRSPNILDLCTGSGNIAICLAHLIPQAGIIATDISEEALDVARRNARMHNVDDRVIFFKGDLFDALPFDKAYKFDIIVCNLPYVKSHELEFLQSEVRREPRIALDGGSDGLRFYRRIAIVAPGCLKKGGSLFLELGFGQAEDVKGIFNSRESFRINKVTKDFNGIDRVIWISLL